MINDGIGAEIINFILTCLVFFGLNFGVFNILIKKFNIATPGRNGNYIDEEDGQDEGKNDGKSTQVTKEANGEDSQVMNIIALLGGKENIVDVDACMTRLRVTVKDPAQVETKEEWKKNGALGIILKDKGVQAVYGPKADVLKSHIQDVLGV